MKNRIFLAAICILPHLPLFAQFSDPLTVLNDGKIIQVFPVDHHQPVSWSPETCFTGALSHTNGKENTLTIAASLAIHPGNYAAGICAQLDTLGHNDWYLPSVVELKMLHRRHQEIGNFQPQPYWTSTGMSNWFMAQVVTIPGGYEISYPITRFARVRCVRESTTIHNLTPLFDIKTQYQYKPFKIISDELEEILLNDPAHGYVLMYGINARSEEPYPEILQLASFSTRQSVYQAVLRKIAFQKPFDANNLTGFYFFTDDVRDYLNTEAQRCYAATPLSNSGFSSELTRMVAYHSDDDLLTDRGNPASKLFDLNMPSALLRNNSMKNVAAVVNRIQALQNTLLPADTLIISQVYAALLEAAAVDMGLIRLAQLKSLDIIQDPAYELALQQIIGDLEAFDQRYWQLLFEKIIQNQPRLIAGEMQADTMDTTLTALSAGISESDRMEPEIFTAALAEPESSITGSLMESICAATIYRNLSYRRFERYNQPVEEIMDYSQYLYLSGVNAAAGNNALVSDALLNPDIPEHTALYRMIEEKRIKRFTDLLIHFNPRGTASGKVADAISGKPLQNIQVTVTDHNHTKRTATTDENGAYAIPLPFGEGYELIFTGTDYLTSVYKNVSVAGKDTTCLEKLLLIGATNQGPGAIAGTVEDAVHGYALAEAQIYLVNHVNADSTDIVARTKSDDKGAFAIEHLPAGNYTLFAVKNEYSAHKMTALSIGNTTSELPSIRLTPEIDQNEIRIALDWGENPEDLDAHFTSQFYDDDLQVHVYFQNKSHSFGNNKSITLDQDVQGSFGPETITLSQTLPGRFRYSVHDYTNKDSDNSISLSNSSARVRLFIGSTLIYTFNVPENVEGTLWKVFEIEGGGVIPLNEVTYDLDF